jgi:hypothetical protein
MVWKAGFEIGIGPFVYFSGLAAGAKGGDDDRGLHRWTPWVIGARPIPVIICFGDKRPFNRHLDSCRHPGPWPDAGLDI